MLRGEVLIFMSILGGIVGAVLLVAGIITTGAQLIGLGITGIFLSVCLGIGGCATKRREEGRRMGDSRNRVLTATVVGVRPAGANNQGAVHYSNNPSGPTVALPVTDQQPGAPKPYPIQQGNPEYPTAQPMYPPPHAAAPAVHPPYPSASAVPPVYPAAPAVQPAYPAATAVQPAYPAASAVHPPYPTATAAPSSAGPSAPYPGEKPAFDPSADLAKDELPSYDDVVRQ